MIQKQLRILKTSYVKCQNKSFVATICGSYRRGLASSGDIDVLLTHPRHTSESLKASPGRHWKIWFKTWEKIILITAMNEHYWWKWFVVIRFIGSGSDMLKAVVTSLQDEANLITDTLSLGGTKFMGVCRMPDDKSKIVHYF